MIESHTKVMDNTLNGLYLREKFQSSNIGSSHELPALKINNKLNQFEGIITDCSSNFSLLVKNRIAQNLKFIDPEEQSVHNFIVDISFIKRNDNPIVLVSILIHEDGQWDYVELKTLDKSFNIKDKVFYREDLKIQASTNEQKCGTEYFNHHDIRSAFADKAFLLIERFSS